MPKADATARVFKVLSSGTRVRMIELLKQKPLCVNALARKLDITPAAVSQHLRVLRDADLVTADKRGYFVHYQLNRKTLGQCGENVQKLLVLDEQRPQKCQEHKKP